MSHVNGSKHSAQETGEKGEFKRTASGYRDVVQKRGKYPPEAGRYHVYIAYACPWANRVLAVMKMKGLEDVIGLSVVHPTFQKTKPDLDDEKDGHRGWTFANPGDPPLKSPAGYGSFSTEGCIPDTVNGAKFVRELYEKVGDTIGKYTVPVFWDKQTSTVVNNESSEILRFLNSEFNEFAKVPDLDLYPEELREDIDAINDWVYNDINNGVYKCGFAQAQEAYDEAFDALFASLDRVEDILSKKRYLTGNKLTEADVRLFMTLIRFDEVYVVAFKTNRNFIHEFPNMSNYVRDLFQTKGLGDSINMTHVKTSYFTSIPTMNSFAIIPKGGAEWWKDAHDRAAKFATKHVELQSVSNS